LRTREDQNKNEKKKGYKEVRGKVKNEK